MMNKPTKAKAKERLQRALDAIPALKEGHDDAPNFTKWQRDTEIAIINTFGEESRQVKEFKRVHYVPFVIPLGQSTFESRKEDRRALLSGLNHAESILASMIDEVEEYWEDEEQEAAYEIPQVDVPVDAKKVFVVHGHDHGTRDMVARFLDNLDLEPVILQERLNQGLTIIEKFEKHVDVGFAVVLFTPDDIGSAKSDDNPRYRARQNVIFELGYLISHIGRSRVAVLYKGDEGDIEIPSDYSGVLYTQIDDGGGWRFSLIGEMKGAGLDVDANQAF